MVFISIYIYASAKTLAATEYTANCSDKLRVRTSRAKAEFESVPIRFSEHNTYTHTHIYTCARGEQHFLSSEAETLFASRRNVGAYSV